MQQIQPYDDFDDWQEEEEKPLDSASDEDLQTVHLYVYQEEPEKPLFWHKDRIIALVMGILTLGLLVGLCLLPTEPSFITQTVTVPAQFHTHTQQVRVAIVPTGTQAIPATPARGTLTIYNGSFLTQQFPANFLVTTANGSAFATDNAVTIPAANPPSWGIATVAAHAVMTGAQGNIRAGTIQQNYGSDILIKNLTPLTGGHDASSRIYATDEDRHKALETARQQLIAAQPVLLLVRPCRETIQPTKERVTVSWHCQYATYQAPPGVEVLSARLSGDQVLLTVKSVTRPMSTHFAK